MGQASKRAHNLKFDSFAIQLYGPDLEIDTDSRDE
jgi:hypothetical protein